MTGNKQSSQNNDDAPVTKREMVGYIGPIFEDLSHRIDFKTHRLEVMMETMKREIIGVMETYSAVSAKEEVVKKHGKRITKLETEMIVVKGVLKARKV